MLRFSAHQATMLLTVIVMVTSTTQATIFEAPQQVHLFQAVSSQCQNWVAKHGIIY